jgi:hypothetical protein
MVIAIQRCSTREIGHEKYSLKDIRNDSPAGDLHMLEEKDIHDRYRPETNQVSLPCQRTKLI